jgi:hypothetical protein
LAIIRAKKVNRENYPTKQLLFWHNFMEIIEKILSVIGKILLVIWKFYKWLFVTGWGFTLLILALMDLWLGDGSWWRSLTASKKTDIDREFYDRLQREITRSKAEEFLNKYEAVFENSVESKSTTSIDLILEKIRNSPGKLLTEILSQEEMEILFEMIVRAFRVSGIS